VKKHTITQIFVIVLSVLIYGCTSTQPQPEMPTSTTSAPAANLTGTWAGTTRVTGCESTGSGRCSAVNNITFTLDQKDSNLTGNYTCAFGTYECRHANQDTAGNIETGTINGNSVRLDVVLASDVSNCRYDGNASDNNTMGGSYQCYQGGALLEEGQWQVQKKNRPE
jgi:hypothetical protein